MRSSTLDSLHTGVSPGSIGWQYAYSGPLSSADLCTTTLGISPSNPVPVPVTCRTVETIGSECGTEPVGVASPGEESSSLLLHQERRVRVFNFTRRGEFGSSTSSGEESSSLQLH